MPKRIRIYRELTPADRESVLRMLARQCLERGLTIGEIRDALHWDDQRARYVMRKLRLAGEIEGSTSEKTGNSALRWTISRQVQQQGPLRGRIDAFEDLARAMGPMPLARPRMPDWWAQA